MKKNLKKLVLNKSTLSNLENEKIVGGITAAASCNMQVSCGIKSCKYICQPIATNATCHTRCAPNC